jgi:hypothetical protein
MLAVPFSGLSDDPLDYSLSLCCETPTATRRTHCSTNFYLSLISL